MENNDSGNQDNGAVVADPSAEGVAGVDPSTDNGESGLIGGTFKDVPALESGYNELRSHMEEMKSELAEAKAAKQERSEIGELAQVLREQHESKGPSESDMRAQLEERAEKYGVPVELLEDLGLSRVQMQDALEGKFQAELESTRKELDALRAEGNTRAIKSDPYFQQFGAEIEQLSEALDVDIGKAMEAHKIANAGRQPQIDDAMAAPAGTGRDRVRGAQSAPKWRPMTEDEIKDYKGHHRDLYAECLENKEIAARRLRVRIG